MIADNEVADYAAQAREFLSKSRTFLAAGDLHQASEKGWGAAAHMAKSVAVAQGWEYGNHADFSDMLYPESTDGRREDAGRGVGELQARWSGLEFG